MVFVLLFLILGCKDVELNIVKLSHNLERGIVKDSLFHYMNQNGFQIVKENEDRLEFAREMVTLPERGKDTIGISRLLVVNIFFYENNIYFRGIILKRDVKLRSIKKGLDDGNVKSTSNGIEAISLKRAEGIVLSDIISQFKVYLEIPYKEEEFPENSFDDHIKENLKVSFVGR